MSFRSSGKQRHADDKAWRAWLSANSELIEAAALPPTVTASRADWEYLLRYGYHCFPAYPHIDFEPKEMTPAQREVLCKLLERTLDEDEKRRGNALWHFVKPPSR